MKRADLVGLFALLLAASAHADEPPLVKKTYTYKTVDGVEAQADVYRTDDARVRPVLAHFHGGALIMGSRAGVPRNLLDLCRREGFALVSFDYRLAPEVKLPAIVEDVEDALRWLREKGPQLLYIDPDRLVVTGGSAGGYLTLLTGFRVRPRPKALVAYWGYGDIDGDWYGKPSQFHRTSAPLVDKDEALRAVGGKVLTGTSGGQSPRGRYYLYLRQNGLWTTEVSGFEPVRDRDKLTPYCPVRNVSLQYPPTMLVHGTEDTDVPYGQSVAMDRELARHGVAHELVTVSGAGHGLSGGDRAKSAAAHDKALEFIRRHLQMDGR
jgi:acetyl esterase/lipase